MGSTCSAEAAKETVDRTQEAVVETLEAVAEAGPDLEHQTAQILAAIDVAKEAVKDGAEAVCATMDAAAIIIAAASGFQNVEFVAEQGAVQTLLFTTEATGLTLALSGGGCCGPKGPANVVVKKLEKGSQAERLGVKRGWVVKSVSGMEVTGLQQGKQLLARIAAHTPDSFTV